MESMGTSAGATTLRAAPPALLALLYASSLAIATAGIDFGHHWDELKLMHSAAESVRSGLLLPRWYNYPSVSFDLVTVALAPERLRVAGLGAGERERAIDELAGETVYSNAFRLRTRTLFASLSLLAMAWVYAWSRAAGGSPWQALFAAAVLAGSWEVGYHARWIAPDTVLMQLAAAVMAAVTVAMRGDRRAGAWLGGAAALAGAACSTKYPGGILLVPVLLAAAATGRARPCEIARLVAAFFAAFLVLSPGVALEPGRFLADLGFEIEHYARGHGGHSVEAGFEHASLMSRYLAIELLAPWGAAAAALFALSIAGAASTVAASRREAAVLLSAPLLYLAYMSAQRVMIVRNLLLVAPFLAFFAGRGMAVLWSALPGWLRPLVAAPAVALFVGSGLWQLAAARSVGCCEPARRSADVAAFAAAEPARRFLLSSRLREELAGVERIPGVVEDATLADCYVFDSKEVRDWKRWIANRPGTYSVVSGPREVDFDFYPDWAGRSRVVAAPLDVARRMGLVTPGNAGTSPVER